MMKVIFSSAALLLLTTACEKEVYLGDDEPEQEPRASLYGDEFDNGSLSPVWANFFFTLPAGQDPVQLGIAQADYADHYLTHAPGLELETSIVHSGTSSLKVSVAPGDEVLPGDSQGGIDRGQLVLVMNGNDGKTGTEYWYRWQMYLPANDPHVTQTQSNLTVAQLVPSPTNLSQSEIQQGWTKPMIRLDIETDAQQSSELVLKYGLQGNYDQLKAPLPRGEWVEIIMHVKWSDDNSGSVDATVNGLDMITPAQNTVLTGTNLIPQNTESPRFRMGILRRQNLNYNTTLFYDAFDIYDTAP